MNQKWLIFMVWATLSLLASCGQPRPAETLNAVDLETVNAFFNDLGEERYTINPHDRPLSEAENHVFHWVVTAISESASGDYEIRELRLSKTTVGSQTAYELRRHTAQGFTDLSPARPYIQLYAVHTASDPELHGVIDLEGPTLLSFWGEGA